MTDDVRDPTPPPTVLIVDDDQGFLDDAKDYLEKGGAGPDGAEVRIIIERDFEQATSILASGSVDVLALDVRDSTGGVTDDEHGVRIFEAVKALQFLPVVFHTGNTTIVEQHARPPLVQVVHKGDGVEALAAAVRLAFDSGLPRLSRGLADHVREVSRDYLWQDLAPQWDDLQDLPVLDVAHLLTSRLARSLAAGNAAPLAAGLRPGEISAQQGYGSWHPARMYVVPPLGAPDDTPDTGDLLTDAEGRWWFVLTPACDLAQNKAAWVQLVRAVLLTATDPYIAWQAARHACALDNAAGEPEGANRREEFSCRTERSRIEKKARNEVKEILLGTRRVRYFHLPAFLGIPDLILDLQQVNAVAYADLQGFQRRASVTPPYTQAVVARYTGYMGRVGLEDPPADDLLIALADRHDGERTTTRDASERTATSPRGAD